MSISNDHKAPSDFLYTVLNYDNPSMADRHMKLAHVFEDNAEKAFVIDEAETGSSLVTPDISLYSQVTPGDYGLSPYPWGHTKKLEETEISPIQGNFFARPLPLVMTAASRRTFRPPQRCQSACCKIY